MVRKLKIRRTGKYTLSERIVARRIQDINRYFILVKQNVIKNPRISLNKLKHEKDVLILTLNGKYMGC